MDDEQFVNASDVATAIEISTEAYKKLQTIYDPISDEYMLQQFAMDLGSTK